MEKATGSMSLKPGEHRFTLVLTIDESGKLSRAKLEGGNGGLRGIKPKNVSLTVAFDANGEAAVSLPLAELVP